MNTEQINMFGLSAMAVSALIAMGSFGYTMAMENEALLRNTNPVALSAAAVEEADATRADGDKIGQELTNAALNALRQNETEQAATDGGSTNIVPAPPVDGIRAEPIVAAPIIAEPIVATPIVAAPIGTEPESTSSQESVQAASVVTAPTTQQSSPVVVPQTEPQNIQRRAELDRNDDFDAGTAARGENDRRRSSNQSERSQSNDRNRRGQGG